MSPRPLKQYQSRLYPYACHVFFATDTFCELLRSVRRALKSSRTDRALNLVAMATPVLYYFELGSLGRGEVVRLFLRELGIQFEDKRYAYDETWKSTNKSLGLSLTGKLPVLEIDGQTLTQHVPILRYLSRRAGAYDGESSYDKYLVDAVSDIYVDWRAAWVANLTAKSEDYKTKTVPEYYEIFRDFYSRNKSGPYLLGEKPTYADFAVFQALNNDAVTGNAPASLPQPLAQLKEAMIARPNIKEYLAKRDKA